MFQVYINILIFPTGIFLHGIHPERNLFNHSAFIHIYIVYGMDPAQLLHVVVKQAGKLYFRFTWSQTQRQISHNAVQYLYLQ